MKSKLSAALLCVFLVSCDHDKSMASDPKQPPADPPEGMDTPHPPVRQTTNPEEFKVAEEEPGN